MYRAVVRWSEGLTTVTSGSGTPVVEIPVDAGSADTLHAAQQAGQAVLAQYGQPRRTFDAQVGDTVVWPDIGDGVDVWDQDGVSTVVARVRSRRVRVVDGGFAMLEPTLGSQWEELLTRQQQTLKKLTAARDVRGASLIQQGRVAYMTGRMTPPSLSEWSWDPIGAAWGNIVEVVDDMVVPRLSVQFDETTVDPTTTTGSATALADPLQIRVIHRRGSLVVSFVEMNVPAGVASYSALTGLYLWKGDTIQPVISNVYGNDPADLEFKKATLKGVTAPGRMIRDLYSGPWSPVS